MLLIYCGYAVEVWLEYEDDDGTRHDLFATLNEPVEVPDELAEMLLEQSVWRRAV